MMPTETGKNNNDNSIVALDAPGTAALAEEGTPVAVVAAAAAAVTATRI